MFANGPPWTRAGVPSSVCTRFGMRASFRRIAAAPCTYRSPTLTGRCSRSNATTMRSRRALRSGIPSARQRVAITSLAAVITNSSSRGTPCFGPPRPVTMLRSWRSFMSRHRGNKTRVGSMFSSFPWKMCASRIAATKLFAAPTAWMSPVKCRLISSVGRTWARLPPVAPPSVPKTGPTDGPATATMPFFPRRLSAWPSPTVVRVLPSPYRVGVVPVTRTNFPWRAFRAWSTAARRTFAMASLLRTRSSLPSPSSAATSRIGRLRAACAISMSATITAGTARRPKGFSSFGCGPLLHEQRASNRLEPAHQTKVEEVFLLIDANHACVVDWGPIQDRREIGIRRDIDAERERAERRQNDQAFRHQERGYTHGRAEFVFQLHGGMLVAHDDRMERRDLLVPVDDRVSADVHAGIQREVQIPEDRREIVVMIPADEHGGRAVSDEPEDLLHLHPLVDQVLRELVFEVAGNDHLFRLRPVEHLAEAFEDHTSLEPRDRHALLRQGPFESEMEVRDHEGSFLTKKEGEVPSRLHALRDLDTVHRAR